MTEDEVLFYRALCQELDAKGCDLVIAGHHWPQSRDLPFFKVPSGLNRVQLGSIRDCITENSETKWQPYLSIDQLWRGPIGDNADKVRRIRALSYFYGYYQVLLNHVQPDLVVIWNGFHPQERILVDLARKGGSRLGYVERGPIPGTIHYDSEGVLAGTAFAKETDWSWNSLEEKKHWNMVYEKVGSRLATTGSKTWWGQPRTVGRDSALHRLKFDPDKPILLFAGQVDRDAQTLFFSPDFDCCQEALAWICDALGNNTSWQLLGKHHPKSSIAPNVYQEIIQGYGNWVTDISLSDALAVASGVVAINSTVLYEGMMRGLPGFALGRGLFSGKNVFYEAIDGNYAAAFSSFLTRDAFNERKEKFSDMMAYLLASQLFDFNGNWGDFGVPSAREFATKLVSDVNGAVFTPSFLQNSSLELLRLLSEKAVDEPWEKLAGGLWKKFVVQVKNRFKGLR